MRRIAPVALVLLIACTSRTGTSGTLGRSVNGVPLAPNVRCATPACTAFVVVPYVRIQTKYGIGCLGDVSPGTTPNPRPPPLTYAASDVGKDGVPALTPHEAVLLSRIQQYVHARTLRFGWVDTFRKRDGHDFIVFDAADGPCEVAAGGYEVLNGDCDVFYQPGENPYSTHAGTSGYPCRRPWGYATGD